MESAIKILFFIFLILALLTAIEKWYYAIRVFGPRSLVKSFSLLRLRLGQPFKYGAFPFFLALLVITIGWTLYSQSLGRLSGITAIVAYIILFLLYSAPPITLFLGTSSKDGKRLYSRITSEVSGGCISLLRARLGTATAGDGVRTGEKKWQKTVRELTRMVSIVIIDTRVMSVAVLYEAEWMLHPDRSAKALFIVGNDGKQPLIDALITSGTLQNESEIYKVRESEIIPVLERLVSNYSRPNDSLDASCGNVPRKSD